MLLYVDECTGMHIAQGVRKIVNVTAWHYRTFWLLATIMMSLFLMGTLNVAVIVIVKSNTKCFTVAKFQNGHILLPIVSLMLEASSSWFV